MLLVGLTGNIASGKSEVARLLGERGATLIDADILAREVVKPGTSALTKITEKWGKEVLTPEGTLDRGALRRIAFSDQGQLEQLNAIVHPEVTRLRDAEIEKAKARGDKVVICVIPLLFERNLAKDFDFIVLVDAPRDIRLDRLANERGLNETDAMNMIASQMPADLKRAGADYCIENVSSLADLEKQVDKLWATLNKKASGSRRTAGVS